MKIRYSLVIVTSLVMQGCLGSSQYFGTAPLDPFNPNHTPQNLPTLQFNPAWADSNVTPGDQKSYFNTALLSSTSFNNGYGACNNYNLSVTLGCPIETSYLLPPPTWCTLTSTQQPQLSYPNPIVSPTYWISPILADLSVVVGPKNSWINACQDVTNSSTAVTKQWKVVPKKIEALIQKPSQFQVASSSVLATPSITYFSAALIEAFSARLAMTSSAFLATAGQQTNFLNLPQEHFNPKVTSGVPPSEQAILSNFCTQAQLLFSWAFYLRNILTPASLNLSNNASVLGGNSLPVTMESGMTLGALETFAGVVVINPYYKNAVNNAQVSAALKAYNAVLVGIAPNAPLGNADIQQMFFDSSGGQQTTGSATIVSELPKKWLSSNRCILPGLTAFQAPLDKSQMSYLVQGQYDTPISKGYGKGGVVTFLPVSNVPLSPPENPTVTYAVQEPADNWLCALVGTSTNYFRQVSFSIVTNGTANPPFTVAVGYENSGSSSFVQVSAPNSIMLGQIGGVAAPFQLSNVDTPITGSFADIGIAELSNSYTSTDFVSFFSDLQPWAVVVQVQVQSGDALTTNPEVASVSQPICGYAVVPLGLIKLNSFDFPLTFAQNPVAYAYQSNQSPSTATQSAETESDIASSTYPAGHRDLYLSSGIAFTQRDVWTGVEKLYNLVEPQNFSYFSNNYSFAYLFLQALFNGHLYSSAPNSLYSVMQKNKTITGNKPNSADGKIGSITYDYTSETGMTFYPLTTTFPIDSDTQTLKDVWPINEPRKEPAKTDWLDTNGPVDYIFLRALMVMRALVENTGVTAQALSYLPQIMAPPSASSAKQTLGASITSPGKKKSMPIYIGQNLNPTAAGSPAYQPVFSIQ